MMSKRWLWLLLFGIWIGRGSVAHGAAMVTANPDPLDFGDTVVMSPKPLVSPELSTNQNVTVTIALDITVSECNQFAITDPPTPTTPVNLNSGTPRNISVTFTPTSNGMKTCNGIVKQGSNTVGTFTLKGNGVSPQIMVTPAGKSLAFGAIDVNQPSTAQPVTVLNNGNAPLLISSVSFTAGSGDYTMTGPNLPLTLLTTDPAVTWMVACKPSAKGSRPGTFTINSNAVSNSNVNFALTCSGNLGEFATDQGSFDFGRVAKTATGQVTVALSNPGNVAVNNITAALSSATAGYAIDMTTVPTTLAAADTKMVKVNFTPVDRTSGGNTTLTFSGSWGGVPTPVMKQVSLTGIEASFTVNGVTTLDFGRFRFDSPPMQMFNVLDDGNATIGISAPFTPDPSTSALEYKIVLRKSTIPTPPPVPLDKDQMLMVEVTPQLNHRIGMVSGHIDVTSDVTGLTSRVVVTGTANAAQIKLSPDTGQVDFGVVDINGPPPTRTVTIENNGNDILDINSLTPVDSNAANPPNPAFAISSPGVPAHLQPHETLDVKVTYTPKKPTDLAGDPGDASAHDFVSLNAELSGSLNATLSISIKGDAVFTEAHGSGGCSTGGSGRGGLLIGLAALALRRRRRRTLTVAAAAAVLMLPLAPSVRADDIGLSVFEPTPATTGTGFALQTPDIGASGSWVTSAVASYAGNPLVLNGAKAIVPIERSTLMQLGVAYALLGRLELGAHIPLYLQSGEGDQAAKGMARGNLALHAKARLWKAGFGAGTFVAGLSVVGTVPTASKNQHTGSDQPDVRALVLAAFSPSALGGRLTLSVNAGPVFRNRSTFENIDQGSGAVWGAGASVRILDELWATGELYGQSTPSAVNHKSTDPTMKPPATTLTQIEGLAGLMIKPDRRVAVGLALGRGLTNAIGTPDLRGVLSLSIVPGGAPITPIRGFDPTGPDIDSDGDGIPDRLDKCPNEPEDKDMFEDQDGCPDPDNDHDGIPDVKDKCPLDPEDFDGFEDADGCPDPDNDHDGIPDAMDKCPNEPEDKDGFEDLDGCPDPDNDHDGIPDEKDKCPNEPETINGFQDDDGCPDKGDSTIVLSPDRIETLDPIQFTGVKLTRQSLPLIEQVGATLRAHPEIVRLRITVHVQPTRSTEADQTLSDKRAQAVRDWLVQWGIAATRLEARGFGGNKPLVAPEQRNAAKLNERLELIILERK